MADLFSNYSEEEAQRISYLLAGFVKGTLTEPENIELDDWINANDDNMLLFENITDPATIGQHIEWMRAIDTEGALERVKNRVASGKEASGGMVSGEWGEVSGRVVSGEWEGKEEVVEMKKNGWGNWWKYAAAVLVVVLALLGLKYFGQKKTVIYPDLVADVAPGSEHATVRLNNGKIVQLDQTNAGTAIAPGIVVSKEIGELEYSNTTNNTDTSRNLLTVPTGAVYRLKLSDGTKVWVNAGSSIEYPVNFSKAERNVTVTGEAFFEVAKDAASPFIVSTGNSKVRVLGTHFNVNSYADKYPCIVSVEEGKVALQHNKEQVFLTAFQEGWVLPDGKLKSATRDQLDSHGWRTGKVIFNDATIDLIMKEVERWYNVQVVFDSKPADHFNIELDRKLMLSKVLALLEKTGRVRFVVEEGVVRVGR